MAGKRAKPTEPEPPPNPVAESPPKRSRSAVRVAFKVLFALALVAGVIAGLAWVGERAGLELLGRGRYQVRVADIRCDSPPGTDRETFLTEVRYLSDLPLTVTSVDPELPAKLTAAFAKHPWVASVPRVEASADGGIAVSLKFRVPVLAVEIASEPDPRVVDRDGVLLPATASAAGLPVLVPAVLPPTTAAGEVWADSDVKRAVELSQAYRAKRIEKTAKGWRITQRDDRVLTVGG